MAFRLSALALLLLLGCIAAGCNSIGPRASGTRNILWCTPSRVETINGMAVGLINSCVFYDSSHNEIQQTVNGVSVELIGAGILVPLAPYAPSMRDSVYSRMTGLADSTISWTPPAHRRYPMVNGLALSLTGTAGLGTLNGIAPSLIGGYIRHVNGAVGSMMVQYVEELNGLGVGMITMNSYELNGVQAGFFNSTRTTNGVQIGAFNGSDEMSGAHIGVANFSKNTWGVQIGACNSGGNLKGAQIGLVNISQLTHGAQIGLFNWGEDVDGVQIGVINHAGTSFKGLQLGLLNTGPPGTWPLLSVSL